MARDDIYTLLTPIKALGHTTNAALNAGANGDIIDMQGETGGAFLITLTGISAGTITPTLTAGDEADLSDGAVVSGYNLQGGEALSAPGTAKIAYLGIKRYVRLTLTGTGAADAAAHAIYASAQQARGALA